MFGIKNTKTGETKVCIFPFDMEADAEELADLYNSNNRVFDWEAVTL